MKAPKILLSLLLALAMIFSMSVTAFAAESDGSAFCIQQMLDYYVHYQDAAETDIARLRNELARNDPRLAVAMDNIMEHLRYVDQELELSPDILPDGLPEDNSLCIVVLGYALNPKGTMKEELVGRLEVALASATKYPNAYILCTGGGTASRARTKTEAGQMAAWLEKRGIAQERIIVEDESLSTIQNAQFSCRILNEEFPQVRHIAIVTSDYHVPRGCLYFSTQMALDAAGTDAQPLDVVGNAAYRISYTNSGDTLSYWASGIAQLAGTSYSYRSTDKPVLSKPVSLEIDGEYTYAAGSAMTLTATALYDSGFSRDVTAKAVFSGVDMTQPGEQLLSVSYSENGTEVTARLLIDVTGDYAAQFDTDSTADAGRTPSAPEADLSVPSTGTPAPLFPFILLALLLALLAFLLRMKIHVNRNKK